MSIQRTVTYTSTRVLTVAQLHEVLDELGGIDDMLDAKVSVLIEPVRHNGKTGGIKKISASGPFAP